MLFPLSYCTARAVHIHSLPPSLRFGRQQTATLFMLSRSLDICVTDLLQVLVNKQSFCIDSSFRYS